MATSGSDSSSGSKSSSSGSKPRVDNPNVGNAPAEKKYKDPFDSVKNRPGTPSGGSAPSGGSSRGGSGGGSRGGSPDANFSTVDGRQIKVTPSGQEVNAPNFSDMNRGPVYVPPPTGGARSYSGGGNREAIPYTPANANFNDAVRGPVNVPSPQSVRASVPAQVASMPAPVDRLAGFERRIEAQAQRQANFERFVTEDKGQTKILGVTWDRPDVQNIRSFANFATGGVNLNPFSQNFGIQTDRSQRSSFGRVTEDIVFGGLSYPFLSGGAAPMAAEKTELTIEAAIRPETRGNVLPELKRAGREVERNEFSFLPGGTPINEAGVTTLSSAVIFGALGAQPARAGTIKTSGARGPIDVEITSLQQGTASGANVRAPLAPRQTTVLRFTEDVTGAQRFTRGQTAQTTLTIRPDGALSRVTEVGKFRFEIEQAPNSARAIAREFKNGELVRARDVPAMKPPKGTATITELFRSEDARTVVQPRPDVLAQTRQGGRLLQVEQTAGRGRTIVGILEEVTASRAVSRAGKTRSTPGTTSLELTFPRGTNVIADITGSAKEATTRLRVGDEARIKAQDTALSRNRLVIDEKPVVDLTGTAPRATRGARVNRISTEVGKVETAFEYASVTRGTLYVERARGRLRAGFDKIQERLDKALDFEQRKPKAQTQRATEELLGIERPKSSKTIRQESAKTEGPLEVINKAPRTKGATRGEFYVEGVDLTFTQPRALDAALRGSSRSRTIVAPSTRIMPETGQALLPGLDVLPPQAKPRQETMPEQIITPLPKQDVTTIPLIDTPFRPRQTQTPLSPVPVFDAFDFGFDGPDAGIPAAFALPFGGGGSFGFPVGNEGRQRFKNQYSPSIEGGLFNVKGTKKQANIATITGLGVRPIIK